jgi:hypothetical protein
MAMIPPNPELSRYVERNLMQAEAQCVRLAALIRCRKSKGRNTVVLERLLTEMQGAVASELRRLPFSVGD